MRILKLPNITNMLIIIVVLDTGKVKVLGSLVDIWIELEE